VFLPDFIFYIEKEINEELLTSRLITQQLHTSFVLNCFDQTSQMTFKNGKQFQSTNLLQLEYLCANSKQLNKKVMWAIKYNFPESYCTLLYRDFSLVLHFFDDIFFTNIEIQFHLTHKLSLVELVELQLNFQYKIKFRL